MPQYSDPGKGSRYQIYCWFKPGHEKYFEFSKLNIIHNVSTYSYKARNIKMDYVRMDKAKVPKTKWVPSVTSFSYLSVCREETIRSILCWKMKTKTGVSWKKIEKPFSVINTNTEISNNHCSNTSSHQLQDNWQTHVQNNSIIILFFFFPS